MLIRQACQMLAREKSRKLTRILLRENESKQAFWLARPASRDSQSGSKVTQGETGIKNGPYTIRSILMY